MLVVARTVSDILADARLELRGLLFLLNGTRTTQAVGATLELIQDAVVHDHLLHIDRRLFTALNPTNYYLKTMIAYYLPMKHDMFWCVLPFAAVPTKSPPVCGQMCGNTDGAQRGDINYFETCLIRNLPEPDVWNLMAWI